jgi:hypothetical protein
MRADIRLWTAIVIVGICGYSIARGWGITQFSLAAATIDSPQKRAEIIKTWSAVPDVAPAALELALTEKINVSDQKAVDGRRNALSSIVSIEPLSSLYWLKVSNLQLITDQPMEQVFASLELSMLTGPNEGYVMVDRGLFGVSLWERLSPDLQRRVALDLVAGDAATMTGDKSIRAALAAQPDRALGEVRAAMIATGLSPQEVDQRLGF